MKAEYLELPLVKNDETHRFELTVSGHTAFIDFKERHGKIWLIHTESPEQLQGKGVATALIEKTLDYLEANRFEMIPLCPLVVAYLQKHPEWNRIVAAGHSN
ncbi:GNAT family N-acetyltransferase [Chitinophaga caeni]|uniref:GNAT family N-acetyltransferase n=1 Tax=Chitinophaga caeni TaxID=2029983 RepID=A0A291QVU1_9BACT|nr:GNAT family N-acetyltransferase [Chitinophaga caeni]ATL47992.1 GNAT family N-acetyltransferase [Chitinophaga caeni]